MPRFAIATLLVLAGLLLIARAADVVGGACMGEGRASATHNP